MDLDNSLSNYCSDESGNGRKTTDVSEMMVDDEGNDVRRSSTESKEEIFSHLNATEMADGKSELLTGPLNSDVVYEDEENNTDDEECESDGDQTDAAKSVDRYNANVDNDCCDEVSDLAEKSENCIVNLDAMEQCEAVHNVYGVVCVSDDMVDGCAVTSCHVQHRADVIVCSSQKGVEELDDEDDVDDDDVEFNDQEVRHSSVPVSDTFEDDAENELSNPHHDDDEDDEQDMEITNPALKDISEEESSDEAPGEDGGDLELHKADSEASDAVTCEKDGDDKLHSEETGSEKDDHHVPDAEAAFEKETEDDLGESLPQEESHPEASSSTSQEMSHSDLPGEVHCMEDHTEKSSVGVVIGSLVNARSARQSQSTVEQVTARLPPSRKDSSSSDVFKEPSGSVVLRQKNKSRRVDSIRKSLIKLGSFGKEHGNGKTKSKKEKDKAKNEAADTHTRLPTPDHDSAAVHGQASGPALGVAAAAAASCTPHSDQHFQKPTSPETPTTQASAITSPTAQQKRISNPVAVGAETLQLLSAEKLTTIQLMHQQAVQEYERKRIEYSKLQTAYSRAGMEQQSMVVKRLEAQMKLANRPSLSSESDTTSLQSVSRSGSASESKIMSHDSSLDSACFMEEKRDGLAMLPPSNHSLSTAFIPKHRKNESLGGTHLVEATKKESSILRSHSDSFKKSSRKESNDNLRQGNSSDDVSSIKPAAMLAARSKVQKRHAEARGKSEADNSQNSSDSAIDQLSPSSDQTCSMGGVSLSSSSLNKRREIIMAIDDQEFESDEENFDVEGGPFSDVNQLFQQPAHLAVFLHYLISNSDPSPVLFYFITEGYPQGSGKELRKWAYEIFSSFLVEKAPLKINVDEQMVENIHSTMANKYDKEDLMRNLFTLLRTSIPPVIADLLADFRSKQALGLGSLYGDHELKEKLDAAKQVKIIESSLWNHFERIMQNEDNERDATLAAALAYYFKHFGYSNTKNNLLMERCSVFNTKDRTTKFQVFSKPSKKAIFHRGHHLLLQQYLVMTHCAVCQHVICGVGTQGYQCQKCELNFHKVCLEVNQEPCSGKKVRPPPVIAEKPKPQSSTVFGNKIKLKRKPSSVQQLPPTSTPVTNVKEGRPAEEAGAISNSSARTEGHNEEAAEHTRDASSYDRTEHSKSADDSKSSPTHVRSRSPEERRGVMGDHMIVVDSDLIPESSSKLPSKRFNENGHEATVQSTHVENDSDFETEAELPSLESIIPKEQLKKMKPKEKKRQEVINELFYTERAHVRNLKVMNRLFYQPMLSDQPADFVNLLFPNLIDMIEVHGNLNKDFKQRRKESENAVVGDFANILVRNFSGEKGERFKSVCARFCEKQSSALEVLKTRQRKDPKLASLLQDAASNSLCRRLELKDFLPTAMQRLTKYPLLIENLLKYTQADLEEHQLLQLAYRSSKEILNSVNKAVQEYENHLKLIELQKKLDKRPIENVTKGVIVEFKNLELTRHTLVYDGTLTWRVSRDRLVNVHVVLLSDILVLLQKQDEKLVLRCQSTLMVAGKEDTKLTHSPVIKFPHVLIKPVATDKCAFFIIATSEVGPQIYDLVASTKDEKNRWCKQINETVEAYKVANPSKAPVAATKSVPPPSTRTSLKVTSAADEVITQVHECDVTVAYENVVECRQNVGSETFNEDAHRLTDSGEDVHVERHEETRNEDIVDPLPQLSFAECLDQLHKLDESIHDHLLQKRELLSGIGQLPEEDSDFVLPLRSLSDSEAVQDTVLTMLLTSTSVEQHINSLLRCEDSPTDLGEASIGDILPPPLPPRSPRLAHGAAPRLPPRLYKATPKLPILQLIEYCTWINKGLGQVMEYLVNSEEEKKQLLDQLHSFQKQLELGSGEPDPHETVVSLTRQREDQVESPVSLGDVDVQNIASELEFPIAVAAEAEVIHFCNEGQDSHDDDGGSITCSTEDVNLETNVAVEEDSKGDGGNSSDSTDDYESLRDSESDANAEGHINDCVGGTGEILDCVPNRSSNHADSNVVILDDNCEEVSTT